jgi:hypothetical protein
MPAMPPPSVRPQGAFPRREAAYTPTQAGVKRAHSYRDVRTESVQSDFGRNAMKPVDVNRRAGVPAGADMNPCTNVLRQGRRRDRHCAAHRQAQHDFSGEKVHWDASYHDCHMAILLQSR